MIDTVKITAGQRTTKIARGCFHMGDRMSCMRTGSGGGYSITQRVTGYDPHVSRQFKEGGTTVAERYFYVKMNEARFRRSSRESGTDHTLQLYWTRQQQGSPRLGNSRGRTVCCMLQQMIGLKEKSL
jgi:hypothetical protein